MLYDEHMADQTATTDHRCYMYVMFRVNMASYVVLYLLWTLVFVLTAGCDCNAVDYYSYTLNQITHITASSLAQYYSQLVLRNIHLETRM